MITGYNTDVRHNEVVFHVQTEDKGKGNPYIESLVYVGGQVLATKRASYAEMLADGQERDREREILALMDHQHRTMIAAIRHGKLDTKLAELMSSRQTGPQRAPSLTPPPPEAEPPPAKPARERTLDQVILEYLTNEADQEQLVLMVEDERDLTFGRRALLTLRASSSKS